MTTYLPNKPQPNDNLDISQGDIQGNFEAANNIFAINHYPFSDGSPAKGKHKFVTMPNQTVTPSSIDGEVVLYSVESAGLKSILKMIRDNEPTTEVALTTNKVAAPKVGLTQNSNGYSWLPGEVLFQWGQYVIPGPLFAQTTGTIVFATNNVAFPNNLFNVQCQVTVTSPSGGKNYTITVKRDNTQTNKNQFTWDLVNPTSGGLPPVFPPAAFYWTAIGN